MQTEAYGTTKGFKGALVGEDYLTLSNTMVLPNASQYSAKQAKPAN